jgi:hypothetical protein
MSLVDQLLALLRDTWEGVIRPFFAMLWNVALGGPLGVLAAIILIGIIVFAYNEARR